jgi:DNA invertase Pin-like site-specific DNA recombinase
MFTDPIDTTTRKAVSPLQVLGAVAELERAPIRERTKDGMRAADKRGRVWRNAAGRAHYPPRRRRQVSP